MEYPQLILSIKNVPLPAQRQFGAVCGLGPEFLFNIKCLTRRQLYLRVNHLLSCVEVAPSFYFALKLGEMAAPNWIADFCAI
ncbi:hypothetical protein A9Q94_17165 [Rhodobacterales bacterium 56_14_T64]|nr:hypothetical protein A9Q94_17165 [Rhodobacterales bacterium 56_14_T64]